VAGWTTGLAGRFSGAWYDFSDPAVAGNIKEVSWTIRLGLDRTIVSAGRLSLSVGLGAEYGEARSWLHNLSGTFEGPRAFEAGGSARLIAAMPVSSKTQFVLQLAQSAYRAHARDASKLSDYNWLGQSLSLALGMRLRLAGKT